MRVEERARRSIVPITRKNQLNTFALVFVALLSSCSKYSTYLECKIYEESNGASRTTAIEYCQKLAREGKIKCDVSYCEGP